SRSARGVHGVLCRSRGEKTSTVSPTYGRPLGVRCLHGFSRERRDEYFSMLPVGESGRWKSCSARQAMKTAIIIGVGPDRGLGAQLCKRFAADGLKVIVAGRTKSTVEAVARDIASSGGQAIPIVADATNEADTVALFDCAETEIDLAIYN